MELVQWFPIAGFLPALVLIAVGWLLIHKRHPIIAFVLALAIIPVLVIAVSALIIATTPACPPSAPATCGDMTMSALFILGAGCIINELAILVFMLLIALIYWLRRRAPAARIGTAAQ